MRESKPGHEVRGGVLTRALSAMSDRARSTLIIVAGTFVLLAVISTLIVCSHHDGATDVHVKSFAPTGEVQLSGNFTVEFSKEIAPDSALNLPIDRAPIEFDPPIQGRSQWIAKHKIRFYPDILLNPSTKYVAEVLPEAATEYGLSLKGERRFEFSTPRIDVSGASMAFEFTPQSKSLAKLIASLEFNYEVNPTEAAKYVSIEYADGAKIDYSMTTESPSDVILLEADDVERSDEDREIRLVVREGLMCVDGNLGLAGNYTKTTVLSAVGNLTVSGMSPISGFPEKSYIRIDFNIPVAAEDASKYVSLEPSIDHKTITRGRSIELRGDFKMGETYRVSIAREITGIDGSTLRRDFASSVIFVQEDIPPQLSFVGRGFYLTKVGKLNIGLSTINVDSVSMQIDRVFANNLVYLLNSEDLSSNDEWYYGSVNMATLGRKVDEFDIQIAGQRNQEVVTPINIEEYISNGQKGVFRFAARMKVDRWRSAQKWVVATDLGLVVKKSGDDLWAWVNSLSSLDPVAGATLTLVSQNNQELTTVTTDADGIAVFESYTRFSEEFRPYLVTASYGDDLSFVELTRRLIPTSNFDVGGRPLLESGYEAFVYDQSGIYLPGDTAHFAAIIRGRNASVPEPFPVRFRVLDPDLRVLTELRAMLSDQGAAEFDVPIPDYVKTGGYSAELLLGEKDVLGQRDFLVEEFVPDRMKVKVETDSASYEAGDHAMISVEAVTLFGPPASGRRVSAEVGIDACAFESSRWKQFCFSDDEKSFTRVTNKLIDQTLDDNGKFTYNYDIPKDVDPPAALKASIAATVLEPGGRGVTARAEALVHPHATYVGMKKVDVGYAKPNTKVAYQLVVVDPDGNPLPNRQIEVSFYKVYWQSALRRSGQGGSYRYVSEMVKDLESQFTVESSSDAASFSVMPAEYGSYLVVARDVRSGASASLRFYAAGWGYAPWAMDNPDRIQIDLDKAMYCPGDVAEVQLRTPFPGKLLLTVENGGILDHRVVNIDQNTATVEIPVVEKYKPNVYISAHLIRSTESLDRDTPVRAFGIAPMVVSADNNKLAVDLDLPAEIRPNTKLPVKFRVKGQKSGLSYLTIAAVDEGICQLTDLKTPDPSQFFFGKRRHGTETYDIYGMILPEIESSLSSTSGGDDYEAARKRQVTSVSVKRARPVAFWSGIVRTDGNGFGDVSFDVPQFNGTIRLMATAFNGDCFGAGEKSVIVREPIVLTPTFPRFIAPTDSFTIPVAVFNGTGASTDIGVRIEVAGPLDVLGSGGKTVTVSTGSEEVVYFTLKARETTGAARFTVMATGNGERSEIVDEVPVRPPVPFLTVSGAGSAEQEKPASFTFPSDFVGGSAEFSLVLTSIPTIKFARSLQYLLGYPHGCLEQTTSRVFPLLHFDDLARLSEPQLFKQNGAEYYVEEGIAKIESMQLRSGQFSFWPQGEATNDWASIYASHFLVEARRAGFAVSDRVFDRMINALGESARGYRATEPWSYEQAIYAGYVLALAGRPERSSMHYMKEYALDKIPEYSRYQLAGSFALAGDVNTAKLLLPEKADFETDGHGQNAWRNLNSSTRSSAISLDILAQFDDRSPLIPQLVKSLTDDAESRGGLWGNTQENAFALLALGKLMSRQANSNFTGTVTINGQHVRDFNASGGSLKSTEWAGKNAVIEIRGAGTCFYYWRVDGLPSQLNIDEYDNDISVRRRYLDENGKAIDYSGITQGDLVVAEIAVKALSQSLDNVAVADLLPAGFEIENTRIQSREKISWISESALEPAYADVRNDRLVFYGYFHQGQERKFYYALRAVTEGSFILPPVRAEAMYSPMKASVSSSGRITVNAPK